MTHFLQRMGVAVGMPAVLAIVIATPIMMNGLMNRGYEVAKLTVAEPLAFLALASALLGGAWANLRSLRGALAVPGMALAMFLLLGAISACYSETTAAAVFGSYFRREGLLAWGAYAAVFVSVLTLFRSEQRWERLLDAMLLASVVPCAYAILQRANLDFFFVANRDLVRPNGTLGNPIFMAAYLALLIPLAMARAWLARAYRAQCMLWAGLAALQLGTLLLTQTRGPLLALAGGLVLLCACLAAHARARRLFMAGVIAFAGLLVFLGAINVVPAAARWAGEMPVLARMVFSLDSSAAASTALASRSAATRLGIWEAGSATFAAAPWTNKLIGYGPESAHVHYFPHMPASVMRTEGHWESNSFDRLHADAFDIGLNFGLLGWLAYLLFFGSTIYAAARALFGLRGAGPCWLFAACTFWCGVLAAAVASTSGLGQAAVPAFALGLGGGCLLFMLVCAWRLSRSAQVLSEGLALNHWVLLVALVSAQIAFWMDAQINIPVLTTRLLSFAIGALILVVAAHRTIVEPAAAPSTQAQPPVPAKPSTRWEGLAWVCAFALTAAGSSFLAPAYDQAASGGWERNLLLRLTPMAAMLIASSYGAWALMPRGDAGRLSVPQGALYRWLLVALPLPVIYASLHFFLAVDLGPGVDWLVLDRLTLISSVGAVFVIAMCLVHSVAQGTATALFPPQSTTLAARRWAAAIAGLACIGAGCAAWVAIVADVSSTAATWVERKGKPDMVEPLMRKAVQWQPHERQYRRQLMHLPLAQAVVHIRESRGAPAAFPAISRDLSVAEVRARENMQLWPHDPWFVFALANVLQFRSLQVLRPNDPDGGARAALEARAHFARAHQMLPAQPFFVRNWAQFELDEGNFGDAADLLLRMEALVPNEAEPYAERIALARKLGDLNEVQATLARARSRLTPDVYLQLEK